ncbi:MAG: deoxyribose-phosphate aldolase [Coprobacillus cateniformis]|uniref:Deoxyribose-phosphate aldolase n=1 Tax=Longibaculum muris TaxID=1796628 RepID=A0A4R3Z5S3_9FIRM|nr:deoxyribose-phosphate aldolase [Longibaculum muris]MBS5113304.1 deoxyribose-phosphate aldolase [Coprobacillus cateniformis]MBS5370862.1 deoxyribose-phosphate aldolase [Coprobacillus cateniformis]MCR1888395.1 deoxyribose-phosphate aldolase [Longibaculum muris]MED9811409.1 deoxyribose-phosphate aldolase [Longibaculum muris]TCV99393.1 deoxyribose-phosphate aldolase [Longibaculum muris]
MNYNKFIDHTALKADTTQATITKLCEEAKQYDFASVCVNPTWVSYCADYLKDTDVKICTVIGFPLGANTSKVKAFEAKDAIENGADEVDMVINIGALKDGNTELVYQDIKAVVDASQDHCVKVIIETCLLTDEEKVTVCKLAVKAGATFVKTSTGFSTGGATAQDVALMKATVKDACQVKASGGVRNYADMMAVIEAGATRIGTSAGVQLMNNEESKADY